MIDLSQLPLADTRRCALAALALALPLASCARPAPAIGDPRQGLIQVQRSACGSCHRIPGVEHSNGLVGPPLAHFAGRSMIAGMLPNTPTNLVRWLRDPQAVAPGNAMPNEGLTEAQAADVAAYLYSLR